MQTMSSVAFLKCLLWCFLFVWLSEKIFYANAASVMENPTPFNIFSKQFKTNVHHRQQQNADKTQSFLELILGIIDTLQFGKRKIGVAAAI